MPGPRLTPTQRRALEQLRTTGAVWSSTGSSNSRFAHRTLQALVDAGLAQWSTRSVVPHLVRLPAAPAAPTTWPAAAPVPPGTVVICLTCEDAGADLILVSRAGRWTHRDPQGCPHPSPSLPRQAALYIS